MEHTENGSSGSDNARLMALQGIIKSGTEAEAARAFAEMYILGRKVAYKMINQQTTKNRHIAALAPEERKEKAHNAIVYIIARYLSIPGFSIRKNFPGYIYLRVMHELYYTTKAAALVSFVDFSEAFRGVASDRHRHF